MLSSSLDETSFISTVKVYLAAGHNKTSQTSTTGGKNKLAINIPFVFHRCVLCLVCMSQRQTPLACVTLPPPSLSLSLSLFVAYTLFVYSGKNLEAAELAELCPSGKPAIKLKTRERASIAFQKCQRAGQRFFSLTKFDEFLGSLSDSASPHRRLFDLSYSRYIYVSLASRLANTLNFFHLFVRFRFRRFQP